MLKGHREGLQVLKDGSVKLTVSISKEDLPEAVNIKELFISADMPKQEIDKEEVRKKCIEALNRAIDGICEPQGEMSLSSLEKPGEEAESL